MPLPTIEVPKYKLKIPSTGKMVTFRPFLVKEEKILLTALETGKDEDELTEALFDIVDKCIQTKGINVRQLAPFDLEYIFLQLRAKSVGEIANLYIKCRNEECGFEFEHGVDIGKLKINKDKTHTDKIQFNDNLGVIMKYPNLESSMVLQKQQSTNDLFAMIANCIDSIYTKEEVFSHKDHTQEEIENFIEQLSPEYFKKIMNFFETMPTMKNDIKCTCPNCKTEIIMAVRGIEDFFV
ncbi:TPA: baseplate protein [Candidatus Woesearchaeota archaeon]|nr:baseplate protein [Candidatus Woesearchaeota archaeon]